jgi:tetratricopeptide (TPR) repeat protein
MKLFDLGWLQERVHLWAPEVPVEVLLFSSIGVILLLLLTLFVKAIRGSSKKPAAAKGDKRQPVDKPLTVAESTPVNPPETLPPIISNSKEALEEMLNTAVKAIKEQFDARLEGLFRLLPELRVINSLEDFKGRGLDTLDLREHIQALLKTAGATETTLEPRSVDRPPNTYKEALIEYIQAKVDEIDNAYMSRVFRPEHYSALGCFYYHNRAFDRAIECFDKAIEANQYNASAWNNKAATLMEQDKEEEALACYSKAIELCPDSPNAWFAKGLILCDRGNHEEGLKAIERAIDIRPIWSEAWYEKGLVLSTQKRYQEALRAFENATIMNPKDERPWHAKGIAHSCLGMHRDALRAYEQAIAIRADDEEAWYGKSIALSYLGMHEEAIVSFDLALSLNRKNYKAWYGRGLSYLYLKQYDYALESFKNVVELNASYCKGWYNKAVVHSVLQDREGALDSLRRAIELDERYKMKAKKGADFSNYQTDQDFVRLWGVEGDESDG